MNLGAVSSLPAGPISGTWYRALSLLFLPSALATSYSKAVRSRFSAGPILPAPDRFEISYLSDSPLVALYECGALYGSPSSPIGSVPNPRLSVAILNVHVNLSVVCDLSDDSAPAGAQPILDTNVQELTGDWDGYETRRHFPPPNVPGPTGIAPTQELGAAIHRAGFEGFQVTSARVPTNRNLVILPENLQSGSFVEFVDPAGNQIHRIAP